jgi:BASS family bile acid:Na+ symporter
MTLGELIAIPFGVAYLLRRAGVVPKLEKYRGTVINWGFFAVVYTIVGLNQAAFLTQPRMLLPVALIAFFSTFVLGYLVDRLARFLGRDKPNRVSLIFLATRKNYGMAAAIALALFGSRGAIPAAVATVFAVVHFVWLNFWVKRMI